GRSPAFGVRAYAQAFFGYTRQFDIAKEEQERCSGLDAAYAFARPPAIVDNADFIPIIFPDESKAIDSISLGLRPEEMREAASKNPPTFPLWFFGCLRYSFGDSRHQTSFAYRVFKIVDAGPNFQTITEFTPGEDVPADHLLFQERPMTAGRTD